MKKYNNIEKHIEKLTFENGEEKYIGYVTADTRVFFGLINKKVRLNLYCRYNSHAQRFVYSFSKNDAPKHFNFKDECEGVLNFTVKEKLQSYVIKTEKIL